MGAARSWSSAAAVEAAADASANGAPPTGDVDDADEQLDQMDAGADDLASKLPAVGERVRVWWIWKNDWLEGTMAATAVQDGRTINSDCCWYCSQELMAHASSVCLCTVMPHRYSQLLRFSAV